MAVLRNKKGFTRKRDWVQYVKEKFIKTLFTGTVFIGDCLLFYKIC